MKRAADLYDFEKLSYHALNTLFDTVPHEIYDSDSECFRVTVDTVASGRHGNYQLSEIAEIFGVMDAFPEEMWEKGSQGEMLLPEAWDDIESVADRIAEEINNNIGIPGTFYFQTNESDGDYDLFYCVEQDDVPFAVDEAMKRKVRIENPQWTAYSESIT